MTCKKCAAPLQPGQAYCHVCNTPVSNTAQPAMQTQGQGYNSSPQGPAYGGASVGQSSSQMPHYSQPMPAPVQNAAMPQAQHQNYQQAPQYSAPAQPQIGYQPPMAGAPAWQQPYGRPAYSQPGAYPQQSQYGLPLMQPWQMQQPMPQNWGYGQPTPPKKWDPKKREKVLQNDIAEKKDTETGLLSSAQCFITTLLGMIPVIGIFFCLFWVNSMKSPKMKRNMAKGMLIIQGIALIVLLVFLIIWVTGLGTALSSNFV